MNKKFYTAKHDAMFKAVFCNPKNEDLLKWLIEKCLNKEVNILEVKPPQIIKKNIYEKGKTLDVLVKVDNEIVNIELNSGYYDSLHKRNAAYIFSKYTEEVKVGENYTSMKNYIQINFTFDLPKNFPLLGEYKLIDPKTKINFIDNLEIYEYDIDKIKDLCYNKGDKRFEFIALLDSNEEEMEKICGGDKHMEKFKEEVESLNKDEEMVSFLTEEEDVRILRNTLMSESFMKGEAKGEEKGKKEKSIEIAKNMLSMGLDIDIISKATGLQKEEIESLK